MTIAAGETITAADINGIKDDVDAILSAASSRVSTGENTTSTSYTNLSTTGPSVTLTTGTKALVIVGAVTSNSGSANSLMAFAVSGATTRSETDYEAHVVAGTDSVGASRVSLVTGLTAGSNTFTAKYKVAGGTGTFSQRVITVIPLGD